MNSINKQTKSAKQSFFAQKKQILLITILLIGLAGTGVYFYLRQKSSSKETLDNPKIVVIPFTNLSPSSDTNYLGTAFSNALEKNLTLISDFEVIRGRELKPDADIKTQMETYRTKSKANLAILGTYIAKENEIEITSKLVSTFDNKTLYEKSFTVANKDISTIPRQISAPIIAELGLAKGETANYLIDPEKIDEEAYRNYLKAVTLDDQNNRREAARLLEKTLEREPNFYSGWILLSTIYTRLASDGINPTGDYFEKAVESAKKAQSISPENPQAGMVLARIATDKGDFENAIKEYKNLPKNDLDRAGKLLIGSYLTRYGGLLDESVNLSQAARKLKTKVRTFEPQLYYRGDYEEFKTALAAANEPDFYSFFLGIVALYQKDEAAMRKNFKDGQAYFEGQFMGQISQAVLLHLDGKTAEGVKILSKAEEAPNKAKNFDGETLYYLVIAYSFLGDQEGAIRAFKKTVENGFFCYPYFISDPVTEKMRNNQEFQKALELAREKHLKFKEIYHSEINAPNQ